MATFEGSGQHGSDVRRKKWFEEEIIRRAT